MSPQKKTCKCSPRAVKQPEEGTLPFATTWMKPDDIRLRKKPDAEGQTRLETASATDPIPDLTGAKGESKGAWTPSVG